MAPTPFTHFIYNLISLRLSLFYSFFYHHLLSTAPGEVSLSRARHFSLSLSLMLSLIKVSRYMYEDLSEHAREGEEMEPQLEASESDRDIQEAIQQEAPNVTPGLSGSPVTGPIAAEDCSRSLAQHTHSPGPSVAACSSAHAQKQASTAAFAATSTNSVAELREIPQPAAAAGVANSLIGRLGPSTILQLKPGRGSMLSSRSMMSEQQASRSAAPSGEQASMMIPYHASHHHQGGLGHLQHPGTLSHHLPAFPSAPPPFLPSVYVSIPFPQASSHTHSQQSRPQGLPNYSQGLPNSSSAQALADNSFLDNLQAIKTSMPGKKRQHSISFVDPVHPVYQNQATNAIIPMQSSHVPSLQPPPSVSAANPTYSITNAPAATVTNVNVRAKDQQLATTALSPLSLLFGSTPTAAETAALAECFGNYSHMPNTAVKEGAAEAGTFPPMDEGASPLLLRSPLPVKTLEMQPPMPSCSTAVRAAEQEVQQAVVHPSISVSAAPAAPLPSGSRSSGQNLPQVSVEISFVEPQPPPQSQLQPQNEDLSCMESLDIPIEDEGNDVTKQMTPIKQRPLSQEDFEAPSLPAKKKIKTTEMTMGESEGGSKKKKRDRMEDGATNERETRASIRR